MCMISQSLFGCAYLSSSTVPACPCLTVILLSLFELSDLPNESSLAWHLLFSLRSLDWRQNVQRYLMLCSTGEPKNPRGFLQPGLYLPAKKHINDLTCPVEKLISIFWPSNFSTLLSSIAQVVSCWLFSTLFGWEILCVGNLPITNLPQGTDAEYPVHAEGYPSPRMAKQLLDPGICKDLVRAWPRKHGLKRGRNGFEKIVLQFVERGPNKSARKVVFKKSLWTPTHSALDKGKGGLAINYTNSKGLARHQSCSKLASGLLPHPRSIWAETPAFEHSPKL